MWRHQQYCDQVHPWNPPNDGDRFGQHFVQLSAAITPCGDLQVQCATALCATADCTSACDQTLRAACFGADGKKASLVVFGDKGRAQLSRFERPSIAETILDTAKQQITFAQVDICHQQPPDKPFLLPLCFAGNTACSLLALGHASPVCINQGEVKEVSHASA